MAVQQYSARQINFLFFMDYFLADVHLGLSSTQKTLPSKYFYDAVGDALFIEIMAMPEYYLTRAEMEIFEHQAADIVAAFGQSQQVPFELIELGAGDGSKTVHLLRELLKQGYQFDYLPIDISVNALEGLCASVSAQLPALSIKPQAGDYFKMLAKLKDTHHPKIVLFLGSNIGNLFDSEASNFINHLAESLQHQDKLLLGVDLIKSKEIVLPAYDDAQGLTRAFNLNLLERINNELGGDFDLNEFEHQAEYNAEEGIARSYLVSRRAQNVTLQMNKETYKFIHGERIKVEISRKYNRQIVDDIMADTPFRIADEFSDQANRFADFLLEISS